MLIIIDIVNYHTKSTTSCHLYKNKLLLVDSQGVFTIFDRNKFSQRILNLRKKHNITQHQLANIIGVTKQTVGHWETKQRVPSLEVAVAIANYFKVSVDYLLGLSEFQNPVPENIKKIIEQSENSEDIIHIINKLEDESKVTNKIEKIIKDLDEESYKELLKYINYLKVRQTLNPTYDEKSAGLDIKENK